MESKTYASAETIVVVSLIMWAIAIYFFHDGALFIGAIFLAFGMITFALILPAGKIQGGFLGGGLLLIGIGGVYWGIVSKLFASFFLLIFGAIGVLVLHRTYIMSPEKQKQLLKESNQTRLVIVRDTIYNPDTQMETVIFALVHTQGVDDAYLSFDTTEIGRFGKGDKYSLNTRKIENCTEKRQIRHFHTTNVSKLSSSDFEELSNMAKQLFSSIY